MAEWGRAAEWMPPSPALGCGGDADSSAVIVGGGCESGLGEGEDQGGGEGFADAAVVVGAGVLAVKVPGGGVEFGIRVPGDQDVVAGGLDAQSAGGARAAGRYVEADAFQGAAHVNAQSIKISGGHLSTLIGGRVGLSGSLTGLFLCAGAPRLECGLAARRELEVECLVAQDRRGIMARLRARTAEVKRTSVWWVMRGVLVTPAARHRRLAPCLP